MSPASITVIIPNHNGMPFLNDALDSIFKQSLPDISVIVIDDHSTDNSLEFLRSLRDPRLNVLSSPERGLVSALNFGLSHARTPFVARMDADDIAAFERLEIQLQYLQDNPHVGIVFSNADYIDENGVYIGKSSVNFTNADDLRGVLTAKRNGTSLIHPTMLARKKVIDRLGGYRKYRHAEDRDLWLRATKITEINCLADRLLRYRVHQSSVSRTKTFEQMISRVAAISHFEVWEQYGVDLYESYIGDEFNERLAIRQIIDSFDLMSEYEVEKNARLLLKNPVHLYRYGLLRILSFLIHRFIKGRISSYIDQRAISIFVEQKKEILCL
ncbi:MAG: glycosyltransferase [Henriciella sp.]